MAYPSPNPALDGESRQTEIIVILSVACTLSTLAVVLRCISRGVILRSFGMDDVVIVPAQILTIASAVAIGLETKYGLGRHAWTMPEEQYTPYMKSFYGSIIVYNIAVCLTKISILLQYQRIFNNTKLRKFIFVGLCFLICWGITLCFLLPLSCIPVAAFWDPDVKGFCLDNTTIWYVMAGVNVVTDFAVFTMPIPVISSLQLPTRQKAMLLIVFTLGVFPCAVSIYRIKTLASVNDSKDASWDNVDAATFSFLELSVGVIAVCLPTLRPILVHAMPRLFGSLLRSSNGRTGSNGPSGGHASRTPFGRSGRGGAESTARASLFKNGSTLRESESTEGLRDGVEGMTRSRIDRDIEFGELDSPGSPGYTVTVVAGWEPKSISELVDKSENRPGIKTTTVVTQKVTFAGEGSETGRRSGDKSSDDGR